MVEAQSQKLALTHLISFVTWFDIAMQGRRLGVSSTVLH